MKHQILAVLTQEACYGLQIRNEIQRRLEREKPINVGQIYSTLDRLLRDELVEIKGHTADGLPLYSLTESGSKTVHTWLTHVVIGAGGPWESMVMQVLMAASLPGIDTAKLISAYQGFWNERLKKLSSPESLKPGSYADSLLAEQALVWLSTLDQYAAGPIPVSKERPTRGRPNSRGR